MKIATKELKTLCKRVKLFVDLKAHLPILRYVLIEEAGNTLTVRAENLEGMHTAFPVDGEGLENFSRLVKFADFSKVIGKLKTETVSIEPVGALNIRIVSGPMEIILMGKEVEQFPIPVEFETEHIPALTYCNYQDFLTEARYIVMATSMDMPKNYTSSVLFAYGFEEMNIIGTDGRRLHYSSLIGLHEGSQMPKDEKFLALVPAFAIDKLARLGIKDNPAMTLTFNEDMVHWEIEGIGTGIFNLSETAYPEYDKIIPQTGHIFSIPCGPALETLGPLGVIANGIDGRDMITITANGSLSLEVRAESMGSANAEVPCEHLATYVPEILYNPDPEFAPERAEAIAEVAQGLRIAFNIGYFEDCIKAGLNSPEESILMSGCGSLEPAKFWTEDSPRITVLMPVRLPE